MNVNIFKSHTSVLSHASNVLSLISFPVYPPVKDGVIDEVCWLLENRFSRDSWSGSRLPTGPMPPLYQLTSRLAVFVACPCFHEERRGRYSNLKFRTWPNTFSLASHDS